MEKLNLEKYRKLIEEERETILKEIFDLEQDISYDDTRTGQSELADYDQHPADSGTDTFEKEKDLAILDSRRDVIGRINEALCKMDRGTYGTCDRCGRQISKQRLEAVPHAIYCVECQDIIEGS